jgi:ornithine cyclodeaminase/alanine dehydrogenase
MEILYLSRKHVEQVGVSMKEVIEAVDQGFRLKGLGKSEMPPKPGIHTMPNSFIHAMPAYVKEVEVAGLKWVSGYPSNMDRRLPYITGLLILNNPETGVPIAVMDCSWITAMRTGASAGISAKYL